MAKIKLGDVFKIETEKGDAYFQYVHKDETQIPLVRLLPGIYSAEPENLADLVADGELYFVNFPVSPALSKGIVVKIGNYSVPNSSEKPTYMRSVHRVGDQFLGWHIVNTETLERTLVTKLSTEQTKLSPWGVINDTLLIERILNEWTPEKEAEEYKDNFK